MSTLADAARAFLEKCRCDGTGKVLGHPSDHHADAVDCEDCAELRAALAAAARADADVLEGARKIAENRCNLDTEINGLAQEIASFATAHAAAERMAKRRRKEREGPAVLTAPGWYCEQCGAGLAEYIACDEPDCGPFRPREHVTQHQRENEV